MYLIFLFTIFKVFTHPYLLKMIIDIEHMYSSNQPQHKKWNTLLSECLVEAEGPSFKYELMFSKEHNSEVNNYFLLFVDLSFILCN